MNGSQHPLEKYDLIIVRHGGGPDYDAQNDQLITSSSWQIPEPLGFEKILKIHGEHYIGRLSHKKIRLSSKNNIEHILLNTEENIIFYDQYCNSRLWPWLHQYGPTNKPIFSIEQFNREDFETYKKINQRYAEKIISHAKNGSIVWIHDYHLFLVPLYLKQAAEKEKLDIDIRFFIHTPFPKKVLFLIPEEIGELTTSFLACSSIGFNSKKSLNNFQDFIDKLTETLSKLRSSKKEEVFPHLPVLNINPIGVNSEMVNHNFDFSAGIYDSVEEYLKNFKDKNQKNKIILSVDRLDPTKGYVQRINAIKTILEENTGLAGHLLFVMAAPSSRTNIPAYYELLHDFLHHIELINKKAKLLIDRDIICGFITPLHYSHLNILRKHADIYLCTSLSDGFHLGPVEYLAARKGHGDAAVILSQHAGCAENLPMAHQYDPLCMAQLIYNILLIATRDKQQTLDNTKEIYWNFNTINFCMQLWAQIALDRCPKKVVNLPPAQVRYFDKTYRLCTEIRLTANQGEMNVARRNQIS